ncbi:uncharacterized protein PAC_00865 [Phialocephala subalpina]|uniref:Cupin type-1 domain-containing protein n=1 Tax=Phialocephala subalpina TaxID=576137 RepID=A0A1L7WDX8_9HELO|nr:uncharacterized protein PAC_00865 [Phialocephala subalpina]
MKSPPHSKHAISLINAKPFYDTELGSLRRITQDDLPILKNLSIKRLVLAPGSIREPHWHANCNELAYCISGQVLVSILGNGNEFSNFTISSGEMFHIESGSLHHIENIGDEEAVFIIAFRHERPKDFSLHASFGAMTDAVLGNTYDLASSHFEKLTRSMAPKYIVKRDGKPNIPSTAHLPNRHKFDVEGMLPPVSDTVEMGYVHKGKARMSVMDPDGSLDTYYLKPGDCYFIPAAYPHQIECVEGDEIHFVIFFDQPMPQDVGYRTSATAMSREVLAATFGIKEMDLPTFPVTVKDPLIVGRKNPVDKPTSKL